MKVLVIRFSSIGDIILTSPVVRCLKLQAGAEIHFLTKKSFASVLTASPYIDQVHTIQKDLSEVARSLQEENFDLILDLHKNLRSWRVRSLLRKRYITFDKANFRKWLMVRFKVRNLQVDHIVNRYMESLKPLGITYDGEGLDYFLHPPSSSFPVISEPYICFGIGGTHATKRLPVGKMREICSSIPASIYLLGGSEDVDAGAQIADQLSHVHNLCGTLSISDSARMVKGASAVLTHDTAIMHIAAAFNRRIFSIWGNTIPEFGMFPFLPDQKGFPFEVFQINDLPCRPCSKIGYSQCPKGHFNCMNEQNTRHIAELVQGALSSF
ncbi:MAG: glycosyltransferase family 9 protein [Saprospiraceae bacterium]|nr:glycosyltransferase family 9 protein [Saprospiraceae bacterium]